MEVDFYQTSYLKINSKWIKEQNVRNKNLRRKHKDHFHDLGLGNGFSDAHLKYIWECPKAWATKEKVDKLKFYTFCSNNTIKDVRNNLKN